MRRIVIDQEKCILAGECVYNHPEYFSWGDDDTAPLVLRSRVETPDDELHAKQAVALCPGGAIALIETE